MVCGAREVGGGDDAGASAVSLGLAGKQATSSAATSGRSRRTRGRPALGAEGNFNFSFLPMMWH